MLRYLSKTEEEKLVISLWTNEYGYDFDIVQDAQGVCIEITINDGREEITYCISNDEELQQGARVFCERGDA